MEKARCVHCNAIEGHFSGCPISDRDLRGNDQMWEYAMTHAPITHGLVAQMNGYGASGWELVQVIDQTVPGECGYFCSFWKRPWKGGE